MPMYGKKVQLIVTVQCSMYKPSNTCSQTRSQKTASCRPYEVRNCSHSHCYDDWIHCKLWDFLFVDIRKRSDLLKVPASSSMNLIQRCISRHYPETWPVWTSRTALCRRCLRLARQTLTSLTGGRKAQWPRKKCKKIARQPYQKLLSYGTIGCFMTIVERGIIRRVLRAAQYLQMRSHQR